METPPKCAIVTTLNVTQIAQTPLLPPQPITAPHSPSRTNRTPHPSNRPPPNHTRNPHHRHHRTNPQTHPQHIHPFPLFPLQPRHPTPRRHPHFRHPHKQLPNTLPRRTHMHRLAHAALRAKRLGLHLAALGGLVAVRFQRDVDAGDGGEGGVGD